MSFLKIEATRQSAKSFEEYKVNCYVTFLLTPATNFLVEG